MKLSNKILLITALALIVVPMVSMFAISRIYFKVGVNDSSTFEPKEMGLKEKEEGYQTVHPKSFSSLSIQGIEAKNMVIYYYVDSAYGVKVNDNYIDSYKMETLADGSLKIILDERKVNNLNTLRIKVYAPTLAHIEVSNARYLTVNYLAETLKLTVNNVKELSVPEVGDMKNLDLVANELGSMNLIKKEWNNLSVNAKVNPDKSAKYYFSQNNIANLTLNASGPALLQIEPSLEEINQVQIQDLNIQTTGAVQLLMPKVQAKTVKGKIADESQLNLPGKILNLLYAK